MALAALRVVLVGASTRPAPIDTSKRRARSATSRTVGPVVGDQEERTAAAHPGLDRGGLHFEQAGSSLASLAPRAMGQRTAAPFRVSALSGARVVRTT